MVDDDPDRPGHETFDDDLDLDDFDSASEPAWSTTPSDPTEAVRIITSSDDPPLSFGADETGPLPHWTAPPTGEMPKVFSPEGDSGSGTSWAVELVVVEAEPALRFDDRVVAAADEPEQRVTAIRTQRPPRQPTRPREEASTPRSGVGNRNLPVAIAVGVAIAAVYLGLSKLGPKYLVALVIVILGLAAAELYESQRKAGYQPATFIGIAACAAMPFVTYWRGHDGIVVVLFASVVATMLWLLLSGTLDSAPMPNASATMLGVVYIGLMGSYAGLILREHKGTGTMFTLAVATVGYDVVGLLAGSAVGRSRG
jgi:phosphatidate cytidylyltransferase